MLIVKPLSAIHRMSSLYLIMSEFTDRVSLTFMLQEGFDSPLFHLLDFVSKRIHLFNSFQYIKNTNKCRAQCLPKVIPELRPQPVLRPVNCVFYTEGFGAYIKACPQLPSQYYSPIIQALYCMRFVLHRFSDNGVMTAR